MSMTRWIAAAITLLAVARPVHAQGNIAGDWHGVLQSPMEEGVAVSYDQLDDLLAAGNR